MLKRMLVYTICLSLSLPALAVPDNVIKNCVISTIFIFSAMATGFNGLAINYADAADKNIENLPDSTGRIVAQKSRKASVLASLISTGLSFMAMTYGALCMFPPAMFFHFVAYFGELTSLITSALALEVVVQNGNIDKGNLEKTMGFSAAAFVAGVISFSLAAAFRKYEYGHGKPWCQT